VIKVHHKAIICVAKNVDQLGELEQLLSEKFGREYVIEVAESSPEVMDIISTLVGINVDTSIIISDYQIKDMSGLELIHTIERKYNNIKMMLLADAMDIDFAQRLVNQNNVFSLIKKPWDDDYLTQLVSDACLQYDTDIELGSLMSRLRVSEQQKSLILESISESIIYVNIAHEIQWKNSIADGDLLKWKATDMCYEEIFGLKDQCADCPMERVLSSKKPCKIERKFSDGSYKLIRYFPVFDQVGQSIGIVLTLLDITDQKIAEEMNASLLEMSKYINTIDSLMDMYNKAHMYLKRYFKLELMCVAGEDFDTSYMEFYGDQNPKFNKKQVDTLLKSLRSVIQKNKKEDFIMMHNTMGTVIAYPMYGKILMLIIDQIIEGDASALKFINTITEQVKTGLNKIENMRRITFQAKHDANTGLYNRSYFIEQLSLKLHNHRELSRNETHSVAMIDLNYFKEINDNFSHIVGDDVLLEIGIRLQNAIRSGDIVARMGGDEFAILFMNHERSEIVQLVKRIQREIALPITIGEAKVSVSSSVGIVDNISKYTEIHTLLKEADKAMYEAKKDKSGEGRYIFFEKTIQKKVERHNSIELFLKTADVEGDFTLLYQPIIDLKLMEVVGFEGLLRWHTFNGIDYMPSEFIPIADESDEIIHIGQKVMTMALEAVKKINEATKKSCYVSVNLTTKQLLNKSNMDHIKKSVIKYGIRSNELQIDITDRFKESQMNFISSRINELRDFGVHVNLDDFGTGSASLVVLNKMDVNEIKIDASYIRKIRFDQQAYKMVKTMVNLAKSMEIMVTAEGVEKKEEFDLLCELGCDLAQGYYFSRPMQLEDAIKYSLTTPLVMQTNGSAS
jgi:diguanylate cyclase (GGDEF)-like protein